MNHEIFQYFVARYRGKPLLRIVATGGGASLASLAMVPGASRVLDRLSIPYSLEAASHAIGKNGEPHGYKSVSDSMVRAYGKAMEAEGGQSMMRVAVSAALTTDRHRRGAREAYVFFGDSRSESVFHLEFAPVSPQQHEMWMNQGKLAALRAFEDQTIAMFVLRHLLGEDIPHSLEFEGVELRVASTATENVPSPHQRLSSLPYSSSRPRSKKPSKRLDGTVR
jgi:hypothetical protein